MNTHILIYLAAIIGSFVLTAGLMPVIKKAAFKYGIVDNPLSAERKIHQKITPLLGGVPIFISVFVVLLIIRYFGLANFSMVPDNFLLGVLLAAAIVVIGGVLDDKYNLQPVQQVIFPLLAAAVIVSCGIRIGYISNPIGGPLNAIIYLGAWPGIILAFFWLMGMMYTIKFLDGLDGLAAGIGAIAALMIFFVSLSWDVPLSATGVWALALLGACLGFLLFNWQPAKIFLGESGSIFLGLLLGVLSIISGSKITTTLLVVGIPALDVLWVIVQRLRRRESPFSHADRKHLHYQLLDLGFSRSGAVWLLYLVALGFGSLGIINSSFGKLVCLLMLAVCMAILIAAVSYNNKRQTNEGGKKD